MNLKRLNRKLKLLKWAEKKGIIKHEWVPVNVLKEYYPDLYEEAYQKHELFLDASYDKEVKRALTLFLLLVKAELTRCVPTALSPCFEYKVNGDFQMEEQIFKLSELTAQQGFDLIASDWEEAFEHFYERGWSIVRWYKGHLLLPLKQHCLAEPNRTFQQILDEVIIDLLTLVKKEANLYMGHEGFSYYQKSQNIEHMVRRFFFQKRSHA